MTNIKYKLNWIDAIRGYAVLGVLCVHSLMGSKDVLLQNFWGLGAKGVQLFYMASAFTLFYSYYNRKDNEVHIIENFFTRRFFRIAPMFYLAIFYYLIQDWGVLYPEHDYRNITVLSIMSHFTFLHGLSPYWQDSVVPGGWSVGVEFIFYLLCPFLFIWIDNKYRATMLYILAIYIGFIVSLILKNNPLIHFTETWNGYIYGFSQVRHIFSF